MLPLFDIAILTFVGSPVFVVLFKIHKSPTAKTSVLNPQFFLFASFVKSLFSQIIPDLLINRCEVSK